MVLCVLISSSIQKPVHLKWYCWCEARCYNLLTLYRFIVYHSFCQTQREWIKIGWRLSLVMNQLGIPIDQAKLRNAVDTVVTRCANILHSIWRVTLETKKNMFVYFNSLRKTISGNTKMLKANENSSMELML